MNLKSNKKEDLILQIMLLLVELQVIGLKLDLIDLPIGIYNQKTMSFFGLDFLTVETMD